MGHLDKPVREQTLTARSQAIVHTDWKKQHKKVELTKRNHNVVRARSNATRAGRRVAMYHTDKQE